MKKILLAFDGRHFSESALQFACKLNEQSPISLTGAFLPQVNYANLWSFSGGGLTGSSFVPLVEDEDAEVIKQNIQRFESFCTANKISYHVHKDYFDFAIPELKKETRYADLLILSSEIFYQQAGIEKPNEYLQEILHAVNCPVLLIPESFDFPNRNILSCDGSHDSIHAIKQFAYLFPEWCNNPTIIAYAIHGSKQQIPEEKNIKELISQHFPNSRWAKIGDATEDYFAAWAWDKKGSILVSGAFGRSDISRLFRKSFISEIIADHRLPIFIAHQ